MNGNLKQLILQKNEELQHNKQESLSDEELRNTVGGDMAGYLIICELCGRGYRAGEFHHCKTDENRPG